MDEVQEPTSNGGNTELASSSVDHISSRQRSLRVRSVTASDRETVRAMLKELHSESVFGSTPFAEARFDAAFDKAAENHISDINAVATLNDRPVGICAATVGRYHLSEDVTIATVQVLYVRADARRNMLGGRAALRLMAVVREIAARRGATHVMFHVTSGLHAASTDRLFRKAGLKMIGGSYLAPARPGTAVAQSRM